jgi:hypothetical protein
MFVGTGLVRVAFLFTQRVEVGIGVRVFFAANRFIGRESYVFTIPDVRLEVFLGSFIRQVSFVHSYLRNVPYSDQSQRGAVFI